MTFDPPSAAAAEPLLAEFADYLRRYGRKDATIASYRSDTQGFIDFVLATFTDQASLGEEGNTVRAVDWRQIGSAHLIYYQQHLTETELAMANSVRRKTLAIRQFFRFLANEELLPDSPIEDVPVPERDDGLPEKLNYQAIGKLIAAMAGGEGTGEAGLKASSAGLKALRDRAILTLIALEGLKSTELIELIWSHHRDRPGNPAGYLHVGGQRKRTLVLAEGSRRGLAAYRRAYFALPALADLAPAQQKVLVSFKGPGGGLVSPAMTRHGLKFLLYEWGQLRGIDGLNAEMLRHYCIRHHLECGMAPEELMAKLGLKRLGIISRHVRRLEAGY